MDFLRFILVSGLLLVTVSVAQGQLARASSFKSGDRQNDGVIKALEAKIVAMEELIREYEDKGVALRERELALEERRIALDKRQAGEDKRIREREIALEQREAEINAYHNEVLKAQDERERQLEIKGRVNC